MNGLRGRRVLITGASSGIGRAIAVRLASEGCAVAIGYARNEEGAHETERLAHASGGDRTMVIGADVADTELARAMVHEVAERWGGLDVLVNNAGIVTGAPAHELTVEDFDHIIAVNLRGALVCAQEAVRHFLKAERAGVIVNVSSVHELIPKPGYLAYSVSKGGMGNLTRTLALEYAARAIRVNGVAPGAIVTPMNAQWIDHPERRAEVESHIPIPRAGEPGEIASVVAFLASDESSYMTGQTLYADGGLSLFADFRRPWST